MHEYVTVIVNQIRPCILPFVFCAVFLLNCTEQKLDAGTFRFAPADFDEVLVIDPTAAGERVSIVDTAGNVLRSLEFEAPRAPVRDGGDVSLPPGLQRLEQGASRGRFDGVGAVLFVEHAGIPDRSFLVEYAANVSGEFAAEYRFMLFTAGRRSYDSAGGKAAGRLVYNGFEFVDCSGESVCPVVTAKDAARIEFENAGATGTVSLQWMLNGADASRAQTSSMKRAAGQRWSLPLKCDEFASGPCLLWLRGSATLTPPTNSLVPVRSASDGSPGYLVRLDDAASGEKSP